MTLYTHFTIEDIEAQRGCRTAKVTKGKIPTLHSTGLTQPGEMGEAAKQTAEEDSAYAAFSSRLQKVSLRSSSGL